MSNERQHRVFFTFGFFPFVQCSILVIHTTSSLQYLCDESYAIMNQHDNCSMTIAWCMTEPFCQLRPKGTTSSPLPLLLP
jgi:hypothetical protein